MIYIYITKLSDAFHYEPTSGTTICLNDSWHCGNLFSKLGTFIGSIFKGYYVTLNLDSSDTIVP